MNPELLWVFIPTIAAISLTPGMCMTLAFTLGLSQGYRRTLWMMGVNSQASQRWSRPACSCSP